MKQGTSWGWIVFWWIIFWPVGLVMTIIKVSANGGVNLNIGTGQQPQIPQVPTVAPLPQQEKYPKTFKCPGCGANCVIKSATDIAECEYCGALLNGEGEL